jgi:hypothetical protein
MKPKRFAAQVERRRKLMEFLTRRSEILYLQADRHEAGRWTWPFYAALLRRRAQQYLDAAYAMHDEVVRLEQLWSEIETERREKQKNASAEKIRGLVNQLDSAIEAVASRALAELNRLRASIDFGKLAPAELPEFARLQVINILRLMAGTNNLHEARNALAQLRRILKAHNVAWERMAA